MTHPIGHKCPVCGEYSDKQTKIKRLGKGWLRFSYGCGHTETTRPKTIGRLVV